MQKGKAAFCLQGEQATNELNNKLAQFSENAMKFTMDGGLSAYDYKADEDDQEADGNTIKALAGILHPRQPCSLACCHLTHSKAGHEGRASSVIKWADIESRTCWLHVLGATGLHLLAVP